MEDKTWVEIGKEYAKYQLMFKTIYRRKGPQWRGDFLREHKVFYSQGENTHYQPTNVSTDLCCVSIGDNVVVMYGVTFLCHDIINRMIMCNSRYNTGDMGAHFEPIKIGDDVAIGGAA